MGHGSRTCGWYVTAPSQLRLDGTNRSICVARGGTSRKLQPGFGCCSMSHDVGDEVHPCTPLVRVSRPQDGPHIQLEDLAFNYLLRTTNIDNAKGNGVAEEEL